MAESGVLLTDRIDMKAMHGEMRGAMHHDPNSLLLEPGLSGSVVWTVPEDATVVIEFACNVSGHYESGMMGRFKLGNRS